MNPRSGEWMIPLAGAGLVFAALAVYANSFSGPFIFDDFLSIPDNPTISHLLTSFVPPGGGVTVTGRPVLNFSFALNHALSGDHVWSYHALNLVIHVLAGLILFGIVRRTLTRPEAAGAPTVKSFRSDATLIGFSVALLWLVHPLQTESVTYMVQRAESLMSLFYLLTLYAFIRGADGKRRAGWFLLAFTSCLLGMATKEVMVSAPVIVLLYDRAFLAGTFGAAWRKRWRIHLALAATWILLAAVMVQNANRGGSAGFGLGVGFWEYFGTQFQAVAHYLWLVVWPHPLIIDYGVQWTTSVWTVVPYAIVVGLLAVATLVTLLRRPKLGFLGAAFFALLAPSSLVPVIRQTLAEHRMYLALAPVVVALVLMLYLRVGRRAGWIVAIATLALGALTVQRNTDYRSSAVIWRDTITKRPGNAAAHNNYGNLLARAGQPGDAVAQYDDAVRIDPHYADAYFNAGNALMKLDRVPEAITHYENSLRLLPHDAGILNELGVALALSGRRDEAMDRYAEALRIQPNLALAHRNLGRLLATTNRLPEAITHLERAVAIDPSEPAVYAELGMTLMMSGREEEAIGQFERSLRMNPNQPQVQLDLALALENAGRQAEAAAHYEAARRMGVSVPSSGN
ncbi:MAG: tetratricopeptide repeat protein [Lacunisphaera sp.]